MRWLPLPARRCGSTTWDRLPTPYQLSLAVTAPGLFAQNASGSGPGAILNQDNTLNGPGHPAAKGSIVQVYLSDEGQTSPQGVAGVMQLNVQIPANAPLGALSIQVKIGENMSQNGITVSVQ